MIRILLLGAGTNSAFHFSKIIKEKYSEAFYIIGTDINPRHLIASTYFLDQFYQVPPIVSPTYYDYIIDICKKERVNYLLPIFDMDQKLFSPHNQDLHQLNIESLGAKDPLLRYYGDKEKLSKLLTDYGIAVPDCFSFSEIESEKQYFIKPKDGYGSTGAKIVEGKQVLAMPDRQQYIIQSICHQPEITVECFYCKQRFASIARERLSTKAGVCNKARVYFDRHLNDIAKKFAENFSVPFCFNLQFMKDSSDKYVVTDVNLRFAGGMGLSYAAGWDEVSAMAEYLLNQPEEHIFSHVPELFSEKYVVRSSTDIVTRENKYCIAFDLDGTLLDSKARHKILLQDLLIKRNINIDVSDLVDYKCDGKNNIDYMISHGVDSKTASEIQKDWIKEIELEKYLKTDCLYPETLPFLQKLSQKYDLVLISARQSHDRTIQQLRDLKIYPYFRSIYIIPPGKNASELKKQYLLQEKAIKFVGDTEIDYMAAKAANIDFEFKSDGFRSLSALCTIMHIESMTVKTFEWKEYL